MLKMIESRPLSGDEHFWDDGESMNAPAPLAGIHDRAECLTQVLNAFRDIADFDDIHQAALRLVRVQDWLRGEALRYAAEPIFDDDAEPTAARRAGCRASS